MSARRIEVAPITLEGEHVRLEPLAATHEDALWEIARDPELWRWTTTKMEERGELGRYIAQALADRDAGRALPFATIARASGQVVGSTRFGSIEAAHRKVEIGWTWIGRPWQRTAINTEAKLLMLRHAFDTWGCQRVQLRTNVLNRQSRAAILRIGATEEGTLRKDMVTERGVVRDTVYFSIVDDEWPTVRGALETKLRAPRGVSAT